MKLRITLILILLGTMIIPNVTIAEPGDSFEDPETANLGDNIATLVDTTHEEHFFSFTESGEFLFSLTGPASSDYDMSFYESDESFITSSTSLSYPEEETLVIDGQIFIRVYLFSGNAGEFTLTIEEVPPGESEDNPAQAEVGDNEGSLDGVFDSFYFVFNTSGTFTFSLVGPSETDFDMIFYTPEGDLFDEATGISYPDEVEITVNSSISLEVYSWTGSGNFTLTILTVEDTDNDTPFNFVAFFAFLIAIPIVRRYQKNL